MIMINDNIIMIIIIINNNYSKMFSAPRAGWEAVHHHKWGRRSGKMQQIIMIIIVWKNSSNMIDNFQVMFNIVDKRLFGKNAPQKISIFLMCFFVNDNFGPSSRNVEF